MYKLINNPITNETIGILRIADNATIPFDPQNTDFANFKKEVNAETAELQDAEGNTMTAAEAKEFISTLP